MNKAKVMNEPEERKMVLINLIKTSFSFLVKEYGYVESLEQELDNRQGVATYHFLRYTSEKLNRQLEIILDRNSDYILIALKRIISSAIPDYYDTGNTVNIKDLDLLVLPDQFNYKDYIVYSEEDKRDFFQRISSKFQNELNDFINGAKWFERNKVDELYVQKGFLGSSGFQKDKILKRIENKVNLLKRYDYRIIDNTNNKEPFRSTSQKYLELHNEIKDVYLKFDISYKDQIFSFRKKKSNSQDYRLLNFTEIRSEEDDLIIEEIIEKWIYEEIGKDGI